MKLCNCGFWGQGQLAISRAGKCFSAIVCKKIKEAEATTMHNDTAAKLECCTGFSGGTEVTGEGLKV
jgi:hypothetical protein